VKVYFFKLVNGESLLCEITSRRGARFQIECPMQILELTTDPGSGESEYVISPWCPFSRAQTMYLNKSSVIMETQVHDQMANEYTERVEVFLNGEDSEVEEEKKVLPMRRICDHRSKL